MQRLALLILIAATILALLLARLGLAQTTRPESPLSPTEPPASTVQPTANPNPMHTPNATLPPEPVMNTPAPIGRDAPSITLTPAALSALSPEPEEDNSTTAPIPSTDEKEAADPQINTPLYPPNTMGDILVLEYHNISRPEGRWTRTPENFRRDLEYLLAHGYYPVNLIDVVRKNLDHVPRGRRPVVLTFDDSTGGQFRYLEDGGIDPDCAVGMLLSMHQAYGQDWPLRATFFVLLNADRPGALLFRQSDSGPQKVRALVDWGMEVGSHTIHHVNLGQITAAEIKWELAVSQDRIGALAPGYTVRSFSVPYGAYPSDISLLKGGYSESANLHYAYEAAVQVGYRPAPSPFSPDFNPYFIPRVQAFQASLDQWFAYYEQHPQLYYVSDGGQDGEPDQHYQEP